MKKQLITQPGSNRRAAISRLGRSAVAVSNPVYQPRVLVTVVYSMVAKMAKHLALLGCLLILGQPVGDAPLGPAEIFLLIVIAVSLHWSARVLRPRAPLHFPGK